MGEQLNPKPSNLTDADWKHGSSDGEIFHGDSRWRQRTPAMKVVQHSKMTDHQMWDVVNYVRTLRGRAEPRAISPNDEDCCR